MADPRDLLAALANLDRDDRGVLVVVAASQRDLRVREGRMRLAAFWSALAVLIAESGDEEEAVLGAFELDQGVARLVDPEEGQTE